VKDISFQTRDGKGHTAMASNGARAASPSHGADVICSASLVGRYLASPAEDFFTFINFFNFYFKTSKSARALQRMIDKYISLSSIPNFKGQ
jgi:hypothetical protein